MWVVISMSIVNNPFILWSKSMLVVFSPLSHFPSSQHSIYHSLMHVSTLSRFLPLLFMTITRLCLTHKFEFRDRFEFWKGKLMVVGEHRGWES